MSQTPLPTDSPVQSVSDTVAHKPDPRLVKEAEEWQQRRASSLALREEKKKAWQLATCRATLAELMSHQGVQPLNPKSFKSLTRRRNGH